MTTRRLDSIITLASGLLVAAMWSSAGHAGAIPDRGLTVGVHGGTHLRLDTWDLHESLTVIDDAALVSPTVGFRVALQPLWFLSLEAIIGVTPYEGETGSNVAMRYGGDLSFYLAQGDWQPIVTVGAGAYHNVSGDHGSDIDAEAHWGFGVRAR